jgi:hypothetical protein
MGGEIGVAGIGDLEFGVGFWVGDENGDFGGEKWNLGEKWCKTATFRDKRRHFATKGDRM